MDLDDHLRRGREQLDGVRATPPPIDAIVARAAARQNRARALTAAVVVVLLLLAGLGAYAGARTDDADRVRTGDGPATTEQPSPSTTTVTTPPTPPAPPTTETVVVPTITEAPTTSTAPSTTVPPAATTSEPPTTTTATPVAVVAPCAGADLSGRITSTEGAAGTVYVTVVFVNRSTATCRLSGTPTVVARSGGRTLGTAIGADAPPPGDQAGLAGPLAPGDRAILSIHWAFACDPQTMDGHTGRTLVVTWNEGSVSLPIADDTSFRADCSFANSAFGADPS